MGQLHRPKEGQQYFYAAQPLDGMRLEEGAPPMLEVTWREPGVFRSGRHFRGQGAYSALMQWALLRGREDVMTKTDARLLQQRPYGVLSRHASLTAGCMSGCVVRYAKLPSIDGVPFKTCDTERDARESVDMLQAALAGELLAPSPMLIEQTLRRQVTQRRPSSAVGCGPFLLSLSEHSAAGVSTYTMLASAGIPVDRLRSDEVEHLRSLVRLMVPRDEALLSWDAISDRPRGVLKWMWQEDAP